MSSPPDLNEELSRAVDRLTRIVDATKLLNSTLDLSELTRIILQIVRDEVGVERGTVFVVSEDGERLRSLVAQDVDEEIEVRIGSGIAGAVAESGKALDIDNAYENPRFDKSFDAQLGFQTRDIYCMPVRNREGTTVGVLQLLNRSRPLTQPDKDFLAGISVHIGLALEKASMHHYIVEKKRIERDLDLARDIQQEFHPRLPDSHGGVELAGSSTMCYEVGGDYFSFFPIDEEGRFIVMLGDVSGKGIGAALVMTSVHATCRALVKHVHSLEQITFALNEALNESTKQNVYLTFVIALVDPIKRRVHLVNAGHNPPIMVDGSGIAHLLKDGGGPPVGMLPGLRYQRELIDVDEGAVLILYTDGVSEAENETDEQFQTDRLSIVLSQHRDKSAAEIHTAIRDALSGFVGKTPANDDSTMVVLKF